MIPRLIRGWAPIVTEEICGKCKRVVGAVRWVDGNGKTADSEGVMFFGRVVCNECLREGRNLTITEAKAAAVREAQ